MANLLDLFKGSPHDNIKKETETALEQELSGIRVKSLVDINNPLIYGNEAIRITNRTTRTLDTMKEAATGQLATGGLIGKGIGELTGGKLNSISDVRNKISDTLGLPIPLIPTRVADKLQDGKSVQDILDEKNGTELGKLLKQSGGGNPKTIITSVAGTAIKFGKDKLRGALFGNSLAIGENRIPTNNVYTDTDTYTDQRIDIDRPNAIEISTPDELLLDVADTKGINLANYSPIYGVDRNSDLWRSKLAEQIRSQMVKKASITDEWPETLQKFSPDNKYTGKDGDTVQSLSHILGKQSIEKDYELTSLADGINAISEKDEYTDKLKGDYEKKDLIPFWIGLIGGPDMRKTHFRALLTGINETVTPGWNSDKFFGNPFEFKTYTNISRSVSFSLFLYCMNEDELIKMWEKVTSLTKYTYPSIIPLEDGELITPPIIDFRLGDIYVNKIGVITSLIYTFPDNGTWEIDPEIGLLPKLIDVSMTIDFIEHINTSKQGLYGKQIDIGEATISEDPVTGNDTPTTPVDIQTDNLLSL